MSVSLESALDGAIVKHRAGSRLVLLCDYDGTLTAFADQPAQALLEPETRAELRSLASRPGVTIGVVSGRELQDLKRMVDVPGLFYGGSSGMELEFEGNVTLHPLAERGASLASEITQSLIGSVEQVPNAWIEAKRFGVTVHFRRVDPALVAGLLEALEGNLAAWGDRIRSVVGGRAVEIVPNLGWTKGTAVDFVLERIAPNPRVLIYVGDEANDLEALCRTDLQGGIAIGVGPTAPTTAQFKLPDPGAVRQLLADLNRALGSAPTLTG